MQTAVLSTLCVEHTESRRISEVIKLICKTKFGKLPDLMIFHDQVDVYLKVIVVIVFITYKYYDHYNTMLTPFWFSIKMLISVVTDYFKDILVDPSILLNDFSTYELLFIKHRSLEIKLSPNVFLYIKQIEHIKV